MADTEQNPSLAEDPIVQSWIAAHNAPGGYHDGSHPMRQPYPTCDRCGWPHSPNAMCGIGATFGHAKIGGQTVYVDGSSVKALLSMVKQGFGPGFHWKNDVYFDVEGDEVVVRYIWFFNAWPQQATWRISKAEWASVVGWVHNRLTPTKEGSEDHGV